MTRSQTSLMARRTFSAARSSLHSALSASVLSLRVVAVTFAIMAMSATAFVFNNQGSAKADERFSTDIPLDDPELLAAEEAAAALVAMQSGSAASDPSIEKTVRAATAKMMLTREMAFVRARILEVAHKQIGDAYVAGSSGPNGFDCSGLTRFVYERAADISLPHYSRAQYKQVDRISRSEAKPGDLVFFFERNAHHVGIYIGDGKMIDAPRRGENVRISPITGSWWGRSFTGMGRILPA